MGAGLRAAARSGLSSICRAAALLCAGVVLMLSGAAPATAGTPSSTRCSNWSQLRARRLPQRRWC